ncbi:MAG TPA: hypothetical protein ENI87_07025, partial [bacterium]|nr:hypothetical protein [bacterium]
MSCDRPDWTAQCALLVLVATGGLAAQKPHKLAELRELNEVDWAVDDTPPAWWLMPRRESGAFPLATREEHARRRLARGFLDVDACRRDLRWQLFGHLRPALGHAD